MIDLKRGDCLELMRDIPDKSIDMILSDLPYEETGNKWDKSFALDKVCKEFERIIKDEGAIVLTGTNAPNVNYQPFRIHEYVYVFGKGRVTNGTRIPMKYFPQKTKGKPYCQKSGRMSDNWKGGLGTVITENKDGDRHPKTIQKFIRDRGGYHPTQKPVALLEYLIKTYTNEGDIVLDNCMGAGSTGVACVRANRSFIGMELDENYFEIAKKRIESEKMK